MEMLSQPRRKRMRYEGFSDSAFCEDFFEAKPKQKMSAIKKAGAQQSLQGKVTAAGRDLPQPVSILPVASRGAEAARCLVPLTGSE
jgi:hypothetical protein